MTLSWQTTIKILLVILLLGAVLRFWDIGENSFVGDEFLDINSSYGYAQTGVWQAWDFNFGKPAETNVHAERDERAFVYKWQVAKLFSILPPTEAVARSISALWGTVSILVVFWSAYTFTRRKEVGLIAAFLCALSVSALIFDRRLRMYAMFFPVYLGAATAAYLALESQYQGRLGLLKSFGEKIALHIPYTLLALGLFGLSLLTHQLTATLVFTVFTYLIVRSVQVYRQSRVWKSKYSVLVALIVGAVLATAWLFPKYFSSFSSGLIFFDNHYSYLWYILSDYSHPLLALLVVGAGAWWLGGREKRNSETWYLYLSFLVPLVLAIWFFRRNAGPQYIFFVQSFVMIGLATGAYAIWQLVLEKWNLVTRKELRASLLVLGLVVLLLPNLGYFFQENNTYHETSTSDNPNYRKVFGYFKKHAGDGEVLITRNFRNYYLSGAQVPVYNFGGELSKEKLTLERLRQIMAESPRGWFIASGNDRDFVSGEAEEYIIKNMDRVSNDQVRGDILVYRYDITK